MIEIKVPEHVFQQLDSLTMPLLPTVGDVIARLIEHYARTTGDIAQAVPSEAARDSSPTSSPKTSVDGPFTHRIPRERGVTVEIENHAIRAVSVRDLYEQVLRFLVDNGYGPKLKALLPLATSSQRFLIAEQPKHPNGNDFVIAVKHAGFFMEAHKSYKTAYEHLKKVADKLGVKLRHLGNQ